MNYTIQKLLLGALCITCAFSFTSTQERDARHQKMLTHYSSIQNKKTTQDSEYLFGDLYGWRQSLANKGISITAGYLQYILGNPIGQKHGIVHTEQFAADFNWQLGKVTNAEGLEFHAGAVLVSGKNLESKTGSAFPLTLLYGGRTFLVGNIYLKQTAYDGGLVFKAGRIMAGDDFLTSPLHLKFLSLAFDSQIALYINTPASGYPYAAWGSFGSLAPSPNTRLNLGIYSANKNSYQNKHHGLDLSFNTKSGAECIFELTYLLNHSAKNKKLPGTYKAGTFYFTGSIAKTAGGNTHGNHGTYLMADQKLYQPKNHGYDIQGLSSFATFLFFPKDRNTFSFYTTGGLVYEGLFSSRPQDTTAIAIAYGKYSSILRENEQHRGKEGQCYEMLFELNHWFKVKQWFSITPAVQYVLHPSGKKRPDAFIVSLQSKMHF